jgi:hypothetical protein
MVSARAAPSRSRAPDIDCGHVHEAPSESSGGPGLTADSRMSSSSLDLLASDKPNYRAKASF